MCNLFLRMFSAVNSNASCGSTGKYDHDVIKAEVALARTRLARLKRELQQVESDMQYKERGLQTLSQ